MKNIILSLAIIFQKPLTKNAVLYKFISNPFKNSSLCGTWADNAAHAAFQLKGAVLDLQRYKKRANRLNSACGCTPENGG
jgi:hypothetical protein